MNIACTDLFPQITQCYLSNSAGMKNNILPLPTPEVSPHQKDWNPNATEINVPLPYDIPLTFKI